MNIASITYHIDELHLFINDLKCKPNIIGASECGLIKNKPPLTNIDLPNFCFEFTPAESRKEGTMIYIQNKSKVQAKEPFKHLQIKSN